jgi:hypothetical protein
MKHSDSMKAIAPALLKAQERIEGAIKDRMNPAFRTKYADLGSVMDACKQALNDNGIVIVQTHEPAEQGRIRLTTTLLHTSGEWVQGTEDMPLGKSDPQGYVGATTYARRNGLAAIIGVCPEDDDGNGSSPQKPALVEGRNDITL